jgi:diguanylate cyclase (GGDEF)-like protein/PAS domain S-box-containing protein
VQFDYGQFFEHSIDMLCIAGADGYFKDVNPAFQRQLGWSRDELLAQPFVYFVHPEDVEATVRETERLALGENTVDFENRYRSKSGEYRFLRWTAVPDAASGLFFATARDITGDVETIDQLASQVDALGRRLEDAKARLDQLVTTDQLTGAKNRRAFEDNLQMIARMASRAGGWMSMIMLDVDHLKDYNDNFGHRAGDEVLAGLARLMLDSARRSDVVARYGDEEFAIILPDTPASGAMRLAVRLRDHVRLRDWEYRQVSVSMGVSTVQFVPGETTRLKWNLGKIVSDAQRALRHSQATGRGVITHATELEQELAKKE